jgi:hypothetical protein
MFLWAVWNVNVIQQLFGSMTARTAISALVASSIMLSGCAQIEQMTTGSDSCNDPKLSGSQRQLCQDDATFNKTVAGGAILGTLTGAATGLAGCAVAGSKNLAACTAIGAGAGLFAGGVAGYVVAKKQEAAKKNIRAIDSVTADLRQQNAALRTDVNAARDVSTQGQRKLAQLKAEQASGQISASQAEAERDRIKQDNKRLGDLVDHMQEREDNFRSAGQQVNQSSADYQHQLSEMQTNINQLKQQKAALEQAMEQSG